MFVCVCVCVCVRACVLACVRARVRACVRACSADGAMFGNTLLWTRAICGFSFGDVQKIKCGLNSTSLQNLRMTFSTPSVFPCSADGAMLETICFGRGRSVDLILATSKK